jgi:hypothetical protein
MLPSFVMSTLLPVTAVNLMGWALGATTTEPPAAVLRVTSLATVTLPPAVLTSLMALAVMVSSLVTAL